MISNLVYHLPLIHSVAFTVPDRAFTCLVSTFIVFSSLNQEENLDIINCSHGTLTHDLVMQASNENGLHNRLIEHAEFLEFSFNKSNKTVERLFGVKINKLGHFQNHN